MWKNLLIKYRRFLIFVTHILLIGLAYFLAFYLRFESNLLPVYTRLFLRTIPVIIVIKLVVFQYMGIFQGLWRYVSIGDLWQILKANTLATLLFVITIMFTQGTAGFPRSIFVLDWVLSVSLIAGVRFFTRLFRERFNPALIIKKSNALIIGAGQAGILMVKECRNNPALGIAVIGFIDDDPAKKNQVIHGVRVRGNRKDIPALVQKYSVDDIILAIPSVKGEVIRDILSYCQIPTVRIRTMPGLEKLLRGELEIKPRQIQPDDLLGREMVSVNENEIRDYIRDKTVLVTGAGGSIGSELCCQIASFGPKRLILWDHNENDVYFLELELKKKIPDVAFKTVIGDVKDVSVLKYVFSKLHPQVVFHSAAHKHVPLMQENPLAAVKNNIFGSRNLIYAANHYAVERFVLISTDKAVNPVNVMGMTKRIAEMILQAKAKGSRTKFMAVRFGNVLGSAGSVVPLFRRQIEKGGPVTVTHPDAERYFMSIKEAVSLVLQAAALGKGGEIFILDMGEQIKIMDIARNMITLSGLTVGKDISIDFVGLRQGEKLSEELLLNIEKDRVTRNEKIYVTEPNHFDPTKLRKQVKELEQYANMMDETQVLKKLKEIIPLS